MWIAIGLVAIAVMRSAGGAAIVAPEATACDGAWNVMSVGGKEGAVRWFDHYVDVAARGKKVWAVGAYRRWSPGRRALIGHWDGARWHRTQLPIRGMLDDVVVRSNGEVWMVGTDSSVVPRRLFVVHGDGGGFKVEPAPVAQGFSSSELVATADGRLWLGVLSNDDSRSDWLYVRARAGGWKLVSRAPLGSDLAVGPFGGLWSVNSGLSSPARVRHWHGGRWMRAVIPPTRDAQLNGIGRLVDGSSFVWGSEHWMSASTQTPILLSWTRRAWVRTPAPQLERGLSVEKLAGRSAGSLWAVVHVWGTRLPGFLVVRERGRWSRVPLPPTRPDGVEFAGALAVAGDDVWVVQGSVVRYGCRS